MRCDFIIPLTTEMGPEHRMANPYQSDQLSITPYTKVSVLSHLVGGHYYMVYNWPGANLYSLHLVKDDKLLQECYSFMIM